MSYIVGCFHGITVMCDEYGDRKCPEKLSWFKFYVHIPWKDDTITVEVPECFPSYAAGRDFVVSVLDDACYVPVSFKFTPWDDPKLQEALECAKNKIIEKLK